MNYMTNKIYARLNEDNIVTKLFSSVFEQPIEGDVLIEEGNDEYHAHVHLKYELTDYNGNYNYKYDNEEILKLSDDEKIVLFPPKIDIPVPNKEQHLISTLLINQAKLQLQVQKLEKMNQVGGAE